MSPLKLQPVELDIRQTDETSDDAYRDRRRRALKHLQDALVEQPMFIKLHAAEFLLELGRGENVPAVYAEELKHFGSVPRHRIGVWRVLARIAPDEATRLSYVEMLCAAYLNPDGPDSVHAAESLAKLQYQVNAKQRPKFEQAAKRLPISGLPNAIWLLALSGNEYDLRRLVDLLESADPMVRGVAAYALRYLRKQLPPTAIERIAQVAVEEPEGLGRTYLVSAAYVTSNDPVQTSLFKEHLLKYARVGDPDQKYEVASALAVRGSSGDLAILGKLLDDADPDVRNAAAHAIVKTEKI